MPGAIAIIAVLVILPIVVCMSGAALAAALGAVLHRDGVERNAGSELLDLNV